jgi:hypothetical protein
VVLAYRGGRRHPVAEKGSQAVDDGLDHPRHPTLWVYD